ncbi:WD40 repeat domain-containing protein [Streptomyces sp. NPDC058335]|uniref:WD40 repeat domain-containing protein n=1 Tax=Streptomyces sp. NPDC058335 TaxID=3346451 RepID=UPI003651E912
MSAHIYRTTTTHHPDRYQPQVRRSPLALDAASWRHPHLASTLASIGVDGASSLPVPPWATRHTAHSARLHTLTGHGEWILAVKTATGEDGVPLAVTASYDRTARVWNPVTGELLHTLDSHNGPITAVATTIARDGLLAVTASSSDRTVIVWNPVSGERLHTLTGHTREIKAIATTVSSDGTPLAVTAANDRTAIVWNLETGRQLHTLTDLPGRALAAITTEDGVPLAVTTGKDNTADLWTSATDAHWAAATCPSRQAPSGRRTADSLSDTARRPPTSPSHDIR